MAAHRDDAVGERALVPDAELDAIADADARQGSPSRTIAGRLQRSRWSSPAA
jgi:hypothetical protein